MSSGIKIKYSSKIYRPTRPATAGPGGLKTCLYIEDVADENSAYSDESCRSLSIWRVVPILKVSRLSLGNERV